MNSIKRLKETKLPPKEAFYSELDEKEISDEDYQHAQNVWNTFNCQTIQDYHDLYLKSDVLLLADIFEKFRKTCLKNYKLDPCHYYTIPGLAWDAFLKLTKQELQLLTDYDMLMMFEKGIRGGITHISKRYAEANNKYMKDYDKTKPSTYNQYLSLYAYAMSQKLPTHGFKWIDIDVPSVIKLLKKKDTKIGYIFEVDIDYPSSLWKTHNDYPLAPERKEIDKVDKLICSFLPKKNYVLHYKILKQYIEMGLILKKVHRGIKFYQSCYMKPYIEKNTKLRIKAEKAKNKFEVALFKLMSNSAYGKTIENIRKRQNVKLVDVGKKALNLSSKPNFDRVTIFDENLIAIHMKKTEIFFNKPIYVGQAILDISKTLMFDFHYNYIKKKYGDKAELLMTDTDSLVYLIQTDDFYEDIKKDVNKKFDTSNFPDEHKSGIEAGVNMKVVGVFKIENGANIIIVFIGLRPKMYTFKVEMKYEKDKEDESKIIEKKEMRINEEKKAKGVKKCIIKKSLTFEDYKKCLFSEEKQMRKMNIFRSKNHDVYSTTVNKVALSANDDKRIICKNKINTLALRPAK